MEFFHAKNIAHRDIKPENILVDMQSPNYDTKLIDFGFAAQSKEKMATFCGTPAFMSPEICAKTKYNGSATDVWASGILLYTMLFGTQPFKANSEPELFKKIIKGNYKIPKLIEINGSTRFEGYPEIRHAKLIKSMLENLLKMNEDERIKTDEILIKYSTWLNVDIDLTNQ